MSSKLRQNTHKIIRKSAQFKTKQTAAILTIVDMSHDIEKATWILPFPCTIFTLPRRVLPQILSPAGEFRFAHYNINEWGWLTAAKTMVGHRGRPRTTGISHNKKARTYQTNLKQNTSISKTDVRNFFAGRSANYYSMQWLIHSCSWLEVINIYWFSWWLPAKRSSVPLADFENPLVLVI